MFIKILLSRPADVYSYMFAYHSLLLRANMFSKIKMFYYEVPTRAIVNIDKIISANKNSELQSISGNGHCPLTLLLK